MPDTASITTTGVVEAKSARRRRLRQVGLADALERVCETFTDYFSPSLGRRQPREGAAAIICRP